MGTVLERQLFARSDVSKDHAPKRFNVRSIHFNMVLVINDLKIVVVGVSKLLLNYESHK